MVSLRYHVVSLAAVLMALAAGVVLGAGPLANAVDTAVGTGPTASAAPNAGASTSVHQLQGAVGYDGAVAAAVGRKVVRGTLAGQRVVIVVVPGVPTAVVSAVSNLVRAAGAASAGQVLLSAAWTDPAQSTVLAGITQQLAPSSTKAGDGTPASTAASALAAAILTSKPTLLGQSSDPATALLAALVQGGFVSLTGDPSQASSLAVLLGPATVHGGAAWLPLADALAAAGTGSVVAAARGSADAGGLVGALRADQASRAKVSSVDCADLATGRLAVVLALAQDRLGRHGQYGMGPGADAPLPAG